MRQLKINRGYSKNPNTGEIEPMTSDDAINRFLQKIKDMEDNEESLEEDNGSITTSDPDEAEKLAKKGANVKLVDKIDEKKAKPDFLDLDKDGDTEESMKKAAADKKKKETNEAKDITLPADTSFTVDLKHLVQKHGKDNTIKLSKALMKKLHDKGEVSVNGTTITFKPSTKEEINEGAEEIIDSYNRILDSVKSETRKLNDDDAYALSLKLKAWFNKNIISEEMQTLDIEVPLTNDFGRQDEPNYIDDEGRMAKSQLHKMGEYANKLASMLDDNTQLEGWVQAKLTKAADYLSAVFHYLDYEMERRGEGETSVQEINMDFSKSTGGKGGRRYIPQTFDVNLSKIQNLNQAPEGPHIKLMSKPDGSVVIGVSPFLKIALEESQRGRTSRDTEIRKRPLLKKFQEIFADDSQFKGALKQSLDGAKQQSTPFGELFISKLKATINRDKGILSVDNPSVRGMSDIFEEQ